jgi:transposase InsO family protein
MDVYSQKNWGFKFTGFGTTRTTIQSLKAIRKGVRMPEVFVADQGSHFTGTDVAQFCEHMAHVINQLQFTHRGLTAFSRRKMGSSYPV